MCNLWQTCLVTVYLLQDVIEHSRQRTLAVELCRQKIAPEKLEETYFVNLNNQLRQIQHMHTFTSLTKQQHQVKKSCRRKTILHPPSHDVFLGTWKVYTILNHVHCMLLDFTFFKEILLVVVFRGNSVQNQNRRKIQAFKWLTLV